MAPSILRFGYKFIDNLVLKVYKYTYNYLLILLSGSDSDDRLMSIILLLLLLNIISNHVSLSIVFAGYAYCTFVSGRYFRCDGKLINSCVRVLNKRNGGYSYMLSQKQCCALNRNFLVFNSLSAVLRNWSQQLSCLFVSITVICCFSSVLFRGAYYINIIHHFGIGNFVTRIIIIL